MRNIDLESIDGALIARVKNQIVSAYKPMALYLFGSAAVGKAVQGSDLDLLVVMDLPDGIKPYEAAGQIRRLFDGWLVPFDILVQAPEVFARQKMRRGNIAHTAVSQGKLLYEDRSAARRLND